MRTSLSVCSFVIMAAACGPKAVAPPAPTGPAPTVRLEATEGGDVGGVFATTGLPAIASDGSSVVVAVIGEDGARGAPNLAVVQKDRADASVAMVVVQTADEGEGMMGGEEPMPPPPTAKLDAANKFLADSHAERAWIALAPMTLDAAADDEPYGSTRSAQADGVTLTWDEGKVTVAIGGQTVVDQATQGWTAPASKACDECDECSNPSFLGAAWIDAPRKLIVARISYVGNDSCWEPDSEDHVVAW